jgi:hypothetical protein
MSTFKLFENIEESIIEWYSDFQNLHDLRDEHSEYHYNEEMDRNDDLMKEIDGIVSADLFGRHKKDELLHYIMGDLSRHLNWTRIASDLFDIYFG